MSEIPTLIELDILIREVFGELQSDRSYRERMARAEDARAVGLFSHEQIEQFLSL